MCLVSNHPEAPPETIDSCLPSSEAQQDDHCAADVNRDMTVDVVDLLELLGEFGSACEEDMCLADVNGDETVNVVDLLALLGESAEPHMVLSALSTGFVCDIAQFDRNALSLSTQAHSERSVGRRAR